MTTATWDEAAHRWLLTTSNGARRWPVAPTSPSSAAAFPRPSRRRSKKVWTISRGEIYFYRPLQPHEEVKLAGKRVAVIGTGSSSGIQEAIPMIAEQAAHLGPVFHASSAKLFAFPAHNGPQPADRVALLEKDRKDYREQARASLRPVCRCRGRRRSSAGNWARPSVANVSTRRWPPAISIVMLDTAVGRPGHRGRGQHPGGGDLLYAKRGSNRS